MWPARAARLICSHTCVPALRFARPPLLCFRTAACANERARGTAARCARAQANKSYSRTLHRLARRGCWCLVIGATGFGSACDKLGGGGAADADVQTLRLRGGGEKRIYEFGSGKADGNRCPHDGRAGVKPLCLLYLSDIAEPILFGRIGT